MLYGADWALFKRFYPEYLISVFASPPVGGHVLAALLNGALLAALGALVRVVVSADSR